MSVCPCGEDDSHVLVTRMDERRWRRRRRLCRACGRYFWTVEVPEDNLVIGEDDGRDGAGRSDDG